MLASATCLYNTVVGIFHMCIPKALPTFSGYALYNEESRSPRSEQVSFIIRTTASLNQRLAGARERSSAAVRNSVAVKHDLLHLHRPPCATQCVPYLKQPCPASQDPLLWLPSAVRWLANPGPLAALVLENVLFERLFKGTRTSVKPFLQSHLVQHAVQCGL